MLWAASLGKMKWCAHAWQGAHNVLCLHAVPSAPGRSRMFVSMFTRADAVPFLLRHLTPALPTWLRHLVHASRVLDGDAALLHAQVPEKAHWTGGLLTANSRG